MLRGLSSLCRGAARAGAGPAASTSMAGLSPSVRDVARNFASISSPAHPGDAAGPVIRAQFDYKAIRAGAEGMRVNMKQRNYHSVDIDEVVRLIDERSALLFPMQEMRTRRNTVADAVSRRKTNKPLDPATPPDIAALSTEELQREGARLKDALAGAEKHAEDVAQRLYALAFKLPNATHAAAPVGGEAQARELAHMNAERGSLAAHRAAGFVPRDHVELARLHGLIDFEAAARVTGSRFYYLLQEAALLELALTQWTMQRLVARGFAPVLPPDLARVAVIEGAGFQAKDERTLAHHIYQIADADMALSATAEIPLAGRYMQSVLREAELPIKMAAFNHCFRTEIGGKGLQTKGIYRVHQFSKVEMFVLCTPEQAEALHEELVQIERDLFSELGLNFRVLEMPTEDLGAPAFRKVDMEACMPGRALMLASASLPAAGLSSGTGTGKGKRGGKGGAPGAGGAAAGGKLDPSTLHSVDTSSLFTLDSIGDVASVFGEISSTSNCTDYQARRLGIRYRPDAAGTTGDGAAAAGAGDAGGKHADSEALRFAYTLNGTACAVPRMIVAILEQFQRADGTIEIPAPLRPFMMGHDSIPFLPRRPSGAKLGAAAGSGASSSSSAYTMKAVAVFAIVVLALCAVASAAPAPAVSSQVAPKAKMTIGSHKGPVTARFQERATSFKHNTPRKFGSKRSLKSRKATATATKPASLFQRRKMQQNKKH